MNPALVWAVAKFGMTKLALCAFAILALLCIGQWWIIRGLSQDIKNADAAFLLAQAQSVATATTAEVKELDTYVQKQIEDAPAVDRVVARTRSSCVRRSTEDRVQVPPTTEELGQASREAEDDRMREEWLALVSDDLRTCAAELDRLDAIRNIHNAQVMQ